jgi:hypothetical protein
MENYEIVQENIGKGTFGSVSVIKHIPTGTLRVWKKINYGQLKDREIH